jgi:lambda family phage portal protein
MMAPAIDPKGSVILQAWKAGRDSARTAKVATRSRAYAGAQVNRLTADWNPLNTSADSEILVSIRALRARSREMVRDNPHARNAVRIVQNNVIGTGIGLQATVTNARGALQKALNDEIEAAWAEWIQADTCHTAGILGLPDMLRMCLGQLVEAGEVILRKVKQPFGSGKIPFALEVIEADRLMDQWQTTQAPNGNAIRMGVEVDQWGRPVAYWFWPTHPGDYQFRTFVASQFVRIPADEIIHLYIVERWPQTRGVPFFHSVLRRLRDMHGYAEAEITAARASASTVGFITSPELPPSDEGDDDDDSAPVENFSPGKIRHLNPGEQFTGFAPSRPNPAMEPFMRYMAREFAAGTGCSYESVTRDYSQSNYSSSRLALLDDRDHWKILQQWVISKVLVNIYREWLPAAVLAGAVNIPDFFSNKQKYLSSRWKPRGWGWIDPAKEVKAYKESVLAGFMSVSDVISLTSGGADAEDTFNSRRQELDMMKELDLVFDTDASRLSNGPDAAGVQEDKVKEIIESQNE